MMETNKLFVGGLSHVTTDMTLRKFFSQWGVITDAIVMKDFYTGASRGFGFVTFESPEMAEDACRSKPHELDGKVIDAKIAMPKESSRDGSKGSVNKLFVGGLNPDITDDMLHDYFSQYGNVTEATIATDKSSGLSRGFAFITFSDCNAVDQAIYASPHKVSGYPIDVKKAIPKGNFGNRSMQRPYRPRQNAPSYGYGGSNSPNHSRPRMGGRGSMDSFQSQYPPPAFGSYSSSDFSGGPIRNNYQDDRNAPYTNGHRYQYS